MKIFELVHGQPKEIREAKPHNRGEQGFLFFLVKDGRITVQMGVGTPDMLWPFSGLTISFVPNISARTLESEGIADGVEIQHIKRELREALKDESAPWHDLARCLRYYGVEF